MRDAIESKMETKRPIGRNKMGMHDYLKRKRTYVEMKHRADDRIEWKRWEP